LFHPYQYKVFRNFMPALAPGLFTAKGYMLEGTNQSKEPQIMAKEKPQTPAAALQALMAEYQTTPAALAKKISMSQSGVRQIAIGQTGITVPVALRFAKYFGTTPDYWINLQTIKDFADAAKDSKITAILKTISKAQKPAPAKKQVKAAVKPGQTKKPKTAPKPRKSK
jgi:addiction module HigA family antidote